MEFVIAKIRKKLRNWCNRFLSLTSKVIILKHILRAMPIYNFMVFEHSIAHFKELEAICKWFLWGTNEDGNARKPLIAWDKITQGKEGGGLGILPFVEQAGLLKLRHIFELA